MAMVSSVQLLSNYKLTFRDWPTNVNYSHSLFSRNKIEFQLVSA